MSLSASTLTFTPTTDTAAAGLLFYPGALVEPKAYAPMARAVAAAGYKVVIITLPFRQAPLARHKAELIERTQALLEENQQRAWILGGHSRGGALAALFAQAHPASLNGLLLIGTSHPKKANLSALRLDVTKVYGSEDGLASEEEVTRYAANLPEATHWIRIAGANHTQFGWYGWQLGDDRAQITRAEQQAATVQAILEQLQRIAATRAPRSNPRAAIP